MQLYYAHPITWYNQPSEKFDLEFLRQKFSSEGVYNPNNEEDNLLYHGLKEKDGAEVAFKYFTDLAASFDGVVFRSFFDGQIGSGVWAEVKAAHAAGRPIYMIGGMGRRWCTPIDDDDLAWFEDGARVLTIEQTKERILYGTL